MRKLISRPSNVLKKRKTLSSSLTSSQVLCSSYPDTCPALPVPIQNMPSEENTSRKEGDSEL